MIMHRGLRFMALLTVAFGALTVFSGGRALFGDAQAQAAVGHAVGFVLWFNFLAGFAYMAVGVALWRRWPRAQWAASLIALATACVAVAFGVHVIGGGAFETRTAGALALRLGFWILISLLAVLAYKRSTPSNPDPQTRTPH